MAAFVGFFLALLVVASAATKSLAFLSCRTLLRHPPCIHHFVNAEPDVVLFGSGGIVQLPIQNGEELVGDWTSLAAIFGVVATYLGAMMMFSTGKENRKIDIAREDAREERNNAREDARDAREDARDAREDARDARKERNRCQDIARELRREIREIRREIRDTKRDYPEDGEYINDLQSEMVELKHEIAELKSRQLEAEVKG